MNKTLLLTTALLSSTVFADEATVKVTFTTGGETIHKTIAVSDEVPAKMVDMDSVTYLTGLDDQKPVQKPVTKTYQQGVAIEISKLSQEEDVYLIKFEYFGKPQISEYTVDGVSLTKVDRQKVTKSEMEVTLPSGKQRCTVSSNATDGSEVDVQQLCFTLL